MNPFIKELFESSQAEESVVSAEDVYGQIYDVLEKEAAAQGIDLETAFTEDEIVEIIQEHVAEEGGLEKVAHNMGAVLHQEEAYYEDGDDLEKVASAFGAIAAQSFREDMAAANADSHEQVTFEKLAYYDSEGVLDEYLEEAATERAYALLRGAHDNAQEAIHFMDNATQEDLEKVAAMEELEDALAERALEILDENGYDVRAILDALDD